MLREGTLVCVWQELVFGRSGVHMGRGTRAESIGALVHIWCIFLQVRNKCGFC